MKSSWSRTVTRFFASAVFFRIVLGVFLFEALWVTFSARYPMVFDEDFHFGIIKIYAHHWLPFLPDNVAPSGVYGAVSRDPSYLFHYLMSFPYRIISAVTGSLFWQIVFLRLIDVALFAGALVLFRKFMLKLGVSRAFTHVAMLLFVLIPVTPLVAGQVNYDNLLLLLTAWLCVLTADAILAIRNHKFPLKTLILLLIVCLGGSLTKYAFLPLVLAAALVLLAQLLVTFWGKFLKELWPEVKRGFNVISSKAKTVLAIVLIIFCGLFAQRYGVNLVRYHAPVPDCAQVLSVNQCKNYGPWGRDYGYKQGKSSTFHPKPVSYASSWIQGMWRRMFFVINGPFGPAWYANVPPLPLPSDAATAIAIVSLALVVFYFRRIFQGGWLVIFAVSLVVIYTGALFYDLYKAYAQTGVVVAVNGRYLLEILLPAAAVAGLAWSRLLRRLPRVKTVVAIAAIVMFLQGGIFEFIVQSNADWNWQNSFTTSVNNGARRVLKPLAIGNAADNAARAPQ